MIKHRYLRDSYGRVWVTVCEQDTDTYRAIGLAFRSPTQQFDKQLGRRIATGRMLKANIEMTTGRPVQRAEAQAVANMVMIPDYLKLDLSHKSQFIKKGVNHG